MNEQGKKENGAVLKANGAVLKENDAVLKANGAVLKENGAVLKAIAARGGVARRKDLVAAGITSWELQLAASQETIQRPARGYYALPDADPVDMHLARHQARRTCLSKVAELGLWLLEEPRQLHVAAAHGAPIPGCVVHRVSGGQSLTDILRQCVKCGTDIEGLCVMESAVVLKMCTIAQLRRAFTRTKDAGARRIIEMIDPQSMSIAETCARHHLRRAGYNFQCQVKVPGVGHLDGLVDGVLGLEIDGAQYHNNAQAWEEDLRRANVLTVSGLPTLHIKASTALYRPDILLDWVRQALENMAPARRSP